MSAPNGDAVKSLLLLQQRYHLTFWNVLSVWTRCSFVCLFGIRTNLLEFGDSAPFDAMISLSLSSSSFCTAFAYRALCAHSVVRMNTK